MNQQIPTYSLRDNKGMPIDIKLLNYLLPITSNKPGFFAEVGANDGVTQSNTMLLQQIFGWTGLLVEPCMTNFKKCKASRAHPKNIIVHGALVASEDTKTIQGDFEAQEQGVDWGSLMNSVGGERRHQSKLVDVPAFTLRSLVKQYNITSIDFMSLDVEGYELEVMKGIDLAADWAPKVFLIELYPKEYDDMIALLSPWYNLIGNFTNYNKNDDPNWGGHNDFLFVRKNLNLKH